MPSFEDMQKLYANVGTHGQQLKAMADEVMQQTWDNDIATRQCYIYDYYHDDQFDKGLSGYNPAESETKIPVSLKFIIKEYKSISKDDPEYHIQFEPDFWNHLDLTTDDRFQWFKEYSKFDVRFPISLYVDIPDDRGIYQKWLIVYDEVANQFPKFGVLKCNYLFTWIKDNGVHRYKRKMWGVEKTQSSYTSGIWSGHTMTVLDEVGKFWLPWNSISAEIKHDQRIVISMLQDEPYVYSVSKIKNTSPKGIVAVTAKQDRFDKNKDFVDFDTGEMYADYYASAIAPEEEIINDPVVTNTDVLSLSSSSYKVRTTNGSKVVTASVVDIDGNDVTSNYSDVSTWNWNFYIDDVQVDNQFVQYGDVEVVDALIKVDTTYNNTEANQEKFKSRFYFLGNDEYLNKKFTVELTINDLSAKADFAIIS